MKPCYKFFLLLLFCVIAQNNYLYADHGAIIIDPMQEVYKLPNLWHFIPDEDMHYKHVSNFPKDAVFFSPYETWTANEKYKDYTGNSWFGLKVQVSAVNSDYALFLPVQTKGSQIYWNGNLLYETRPFDKNGKTSDIMGRPAFISIPKNLFQKGENSLVIRIGYLNDIGGTMYPILFGHYWSIEQSWSRFIIWNSTLFSINLFICIYFLFIYYKRRNEKYYLYFSLFSLSLGLWIIGFRGLIFFILDYQIVYILFTYAGAIASAIMFINFLYNFLELKKSIFAKALLLLYFFLMISLLGELMITGAIFYFHKYYLYDFFMLINVALGPFGIYLCIMGIIRKRPYAMRILAGTSIYMMSFLLSVPFFLDIILIEPILLEGFFGMTILFASVLASRFAQVHNDFEQSNINLKEINDEKGKAIASLNIYKYIVSTSPDIMSFIDLRGKFLEVNSHFLKAFKMDRLEVVNNSIENVFGKKEYERSMRECFEACCSGETVVFERWQKYPGIGRRFMVTTLYPYFSDGDRQTGIVYYSTDITERIEFEQEMVALSENERNAIGMELHDNLAQKLFGIALKAMVLAGDMGDRFPELKGAALEIEGLINQAMAYTRTIAKNMSRMDMEEGGFMSSLLELKRLLEARYSIALDIYMDKDIVHGNKLFYSQIYYIIQEAVTNSVKHSGAEKIHVSIKRNSGDIILLVKDNGSGIHDRADKRKGIGLKIMKYRARMIGSSISIRRGEGGGTEMSCVIPLN